MFGTVRIRSGRKVVTFDSQNCRRPVYPFLRPRTSQRPVPIRSLMVGEYELGERRVRADGEWMVSVPVGSGRVDFATPELEDEKGSSLPVGRWRSFGGPTPLSLLLPR